MLQLVGFDCDGVLFDSRQANIAFYNAILSRFGQPPLTPEAVDFVHSHTFRESLDHIFAGFPHFDAVLAYCQTLDYSPFIPMMQEAPHLREFLGYLRPRLKVALATNRTTTTHAVLAHHRLADQFDLVVCALDVSRPKPHPESFWRILEHFRLSPENAIYIGDSQVDEEFAANAGVPLVAYRNPGLHAAYHLDSFAQARDLIESLLRRS